MPAVTVACPHCDRSYSVDGSLIGRKARCKNCEQSFALTPSGETARPAVAPAAQSSSENHPGSRAPDLSLPQSIGRFLITQRLGSGAFGTVYRATDPLLGREVALKVPQPGLLQNPKAVERFLREARAAASLRHPSIVTLFETGIDRGEYYIATEFIAGTTLAEAVDPAGIDPRRAAEVVAALAEALQFAHAQGIVHRDVKPANVMLDRDGQPHLMDFGLARIEGATGERLTQTGAIVGTPAYMAPEQAAGGGAEADAASDQYSLGVTLYELLTGRTPFSGPPEVVIYNLAHRDFPRPRSLRREIPRDLETMGLKALAKAPAQRYASCQELAEDLRRWLRDEPIQARRPGRLESTRRWVRRHRVAAGLAASLVTGLVLLGAGMVTSRPKPAEPPPVAAHGPGVESEIPGATAIVPEPRPNRIASRPGTELPQSSEAKGNGGPPPAGPRPASASKVAESAPVKSNDPSPPATAKSPRKPDPDQKLTYAERIRAAYQACKVGKPGRAQGLLAGCPADSRGWEWSYCQRLSRFHLTTLVGHTGPVYCVAFSPDGKRLASGGQDASVRLWDERGSGTPLLRHSKPVTRLAFTADGSRIISVGRDKSTIEVIPWEAASGKPLPTRSIPFEGLTALDISADARWIAAGNHKGTIQVWNVEGGQEGFSGTSERARSIRDLMVSPDGQAVVYRTSDGWTLLHRGAAKEAARKRNPEAVAKKGPNIRSMALSPDGRQLAAAAGDLVTIYDPSTKQRAGGFQGRSGVVTALAFSHEGKLLATGTSDDAIETIEIWDTVTGQWTTTLQGHTRGLSSIRFSPDDRRIAASSLDEKVYIWGISDGLNEKIVRLPFARTDPVINTNGSVWSDYGGSPRISLPDQGSQIVLYQPIGHPAQPSIVIGNRDHPLHGCKARVYWLDRKDFSIIDTMTSVSTLSDDSRLAAFCDSGRILVRAVADGSSLFETDLNKCLVRPSPHVTPFKTSYFFYPGDITIIDKERIYINHEGATGTKPEEQYNSIGVWDQRKGDWDWRRVFPGVSTSPLFDSRFVPKTGHLVMTSKPSSGFAVDVVRNKKHRMAWMVPEGTIAVLSAQSGDLLREFPGDSYRLHPDGDPIAILRKGRISVRSMRDGNELGKFQGADCSFSPSGKLLATWEKGYAAVWDLESGREHFRFAPGSPMVFSPEGRRVLTVRKNAILIKDASTGKDLLELPGPTARFTFSPDGSSIIAADFDRAKIWVADRPEASPRPE